MLIFKVSCDLFNFCILLHCCSFVLWCWLCYSSFIMHVNFSFSLSHPVSTSQCGSDKKEIQILHLISPDVTFQMPSPLLHGSDRKHNSEAETACMNFLPYFVPLNRNALKYILHEPKHAVLSCDAFLLFCNPNPVIENTIRLLTVEKRGHKCLVNIPQWLKWEYVFIII